MLVTNEDQLVCPLNVLAKNLPKPLTNPNIEFVWILIMDVLQGWYYRMVKKDIKNLMKDQPIID